MHHIHSNGVIHFDIKPANILISPAGSLKIADFGLASRWPRLTAPEIVRGSGLGEDPEAFASVDVSRLEREGDRVYMPPEMLQGVFWKEADIFRCVLSNNKHSGLTHSFGLVLLEVATNICVPDGGEAWHALRSDDFSVIDISPLSAALQDLITQCMRADYHRRPPIEHVVNHPVVRRAANGKSALAPEDKGWLVEVLAGGFESTSTSFLPLGMEGMAGMSLRDGGDDVEMSEM